MREVFSACVKMCDQLYFNKKYQYQPILGKEESSGLFLCTFIGLTDFEFKILTVSIKLMFKYIMKSVWKHRVIGTIFFISATVHFSQAGMFLLSGSHKRF